MNLGLAAVAGGTVAPMEAIGVHETALTLAPHSERRDDWAYSRQGLGHALETPAGRTDD